MTVGKIMENIEVIDEKQNVDDYNIEPTLENGIYYLKKLYIELKKRCKKQFNSAKIYNKMNTSMNYLLSNPILFIGFIIIVATLVVPILIFVIFAVINVALAFSSFIIIEVMLLMIGITVIFCIIFFITATIVLTGLAFALSFYSLNCLYIVFKKQLYYR